MVSLEQAVALHAELCGDAESEDGVHGDALSPESGLPSSESPIVYRRGRLGSTGARDSPPGGSVPSQSRQWRSFRRGFAHSRNAHRDRRDSADDRSITGVADMPRLSL